jgi:hypothetical protein
MKTLGREALRTSTVTEAEAFRVSLATVSVKLYVPRGEE